MCCSLMILLFQESVPFLHLIIIVCDINLDGPGAQWLIKLNRPENVWLFMCVGLRVSTGVLVSVCPPRVYGLMS